MGHRISTLILSSLLVQACDCGSGDALDRVEAKLSVEPESIDFGAQRVGSTTTRIVTVRNTGVIDVELGNIALVDFASFQIEESVDDERKILAPGGVREIEVSFVPGREGEHSSALSIEANDGKEEHFVELSGRAEMVRGSCGLEITPHALDFANTDEHELTARNISTEPCTISASAIEGPAAAAFTFVGTLPVSIPAGGGALLHVLFWPASNVSGRAELILSTDDLGAPQKRIALSAPVAERRLCVEPRSLHFARAMGTSAQQITLTACGATAVDVSGLDFTTANPEISIAGAPALPMQIPPGQTRMITIQYTPENQDDDRAVLTVRSNDSTSSSVDVEITGSPDIVPPDAGRYLYYWRVGTFEASDIMRAPLQNNGAPTAFWGQSTNQGCPGCHQVSPDGRYVAIVEFDFAESMFVVDTASGTKLNLDPQSASATTFSWNPNVNTNPPYQYVFSTGGELHKASLTGGYIGELTGANQRGSAQAMPAWGPNGKIAFVRGADDEEFSGFGFAGPSELFLIDENGGTATRVSGASGDGRAHYYPSFSPNGMWIAYTESTSALTTYAAPDAQVRIVKADNSGTVKQLSSINGGGGATSFPTWSLDGAYLGFSSNRAGGRGDWDLYVAPIDPISGTDGAPTNVSNANTEGFEHAAQWSP